MSARQRRDDSSKDGWGGTQEGSMAGDGPAARGSNDRQKVNPTSRNKKCVCMYSCAGVLSGVMCVIFAPGYMCTLCLPAVVFSQDKYECMGYMNAQYIK